MSNPVTSSEAIAMSDLFRKYDVPAPRYTSYPTVPFWSEVPTTEQWLKELAKAFDSETATWSLYFHLPFCESGIFILNAFRNCDGGRCSGFISAEARRHFSLPRILNGS